MCDPDSSDENNEEDSDKDAGDISDAELRNLQCNEKTSKSRKAKLKPKSKDNVQKVISRLS